MRARLAIVAAAALALCAGHALGAGSASDELRQLFTDYTVMWSAKDADGIWAKVYRPGRGLQFQTAADVAKSLKALSDQGYDHSVINSVRPCQLAAQDGVVEFRYTRFKTDGGFMPPKDRAGLYVVHKFPEGWRIVSILPMDARAKVDCTSVPAE
jgi:hypothetical protein